MPSTTDKPRVWVRRWVAPVLLAAVFAAVTLAARVPGSPVRFTWALPVEMFAAMWVTGMVLIRRDWQ